VGAFLDGRYRIVRFIAAGGMGEVYEAVDEALGAEIALKTIRPEVVARETVMERFHREILLARRVTIPTCVGSSTSAATPFPAAFPWPSSPWSCFRERRCASTCANAEPERPGSAALAAQMGAGLAAAHDAGVVHRDFKPANVMLVPGRGSGHPLRVVITDFGLAWAGDIDTSITRTDHIVGTAAYVAPEQVEGREVTAQSDIYAFGVVLYEMVTGRLPFEGDSPLSTVLKRFHDAPASRETTPRPWIGPGRPRSCAASSAIPTTALPPRTTWWRRSGARPSRSCRGPARASGLVGEGWRRPGRRGLAAAGTTYLWTHRPRLRPQRSRRCRWPQHRAARSRFSGSRTSRPTGAGLALHRPLGDVHG
jgi:serine/threonine protein kinase